MRLTALALQRAAGRLFVLPLCLGLTALLRLKAGYRIERHAELRRRFRELTRTRGPIIVCANHLTMIDSVILLWAFASPWRYFAEYRLFCWNVPAAENTRARWSWRVLTYLSKCILVHRFGDAEHTGGVLARLRELAGQDELIMLFPEGTRSRSGRVDRAAVTYGVGKLLCALRDCRVLCVYLRGRGQERYSDFPRHKEIFDITVEELRPKAESSGLRGAREYATQIVAKLAELEERYFESREVDRKRHRGSRGPGTKPSGSLPVTGIHPARAGVDSR